MGLTLPLILSLSKDVVRLKMVVPPPLIPSLSQGNPVVPAKAGTSP